MAQGFITYSDDKSQCLEDIGYEYFKILHWRSFFQEPKVGEFGDIMTCKMHDLMHDLAIKVAGSNSVIIDQNPKISSEKCLHVSLVNFGFDTKSVQKRLRTLLLHNGKGMSFSKLKDFLSKYKRLRALSIPSLEIKELPRNLCELEHLRYLNLSENSKLKELPSSFKRLKNLQTLNLKNCDRLVRLPRKMKKLVNLRHLMIEGCDGLREMPSEFGYMSSLHTLDRFVASESSGLHELSNLINNLQGSLTIEGLSDTDTTNYSASKTTSERVICQGNHRLQFLELQRIAVENDKMSLEGLQPPSSLKELNVWDFKGVTLGGWAFKWNNLVKLNLLRCMKCQYLPKLDQLRFLKELMISGVEAEYMCSSAEDDYDKSFFFNSLVRLRIEECPNLKWWWWNKKVDWKNIRSFPRLSNLSIYHCPHLTSMPLFPSIEKVKLRGSSSMVLENIKLNNSSSLRSIKINNSQDLTSLLVEGIHKLPSLESIDIRSCPNLTVVEGKDNLPPLKSIYVYNSPNLTSIPDNFRKVKNFYIKDCPKLEQR
ncbi:putative disease resistance protein RGA1 isoform X1 [Cannabis sativa]|uniref:putative disease resistance protein RGA1 isoform X1 n=1 Tax=Cannabis sativa TaxID=3483 RepID=UPI0029CA6E49|nr:putative disease resistance protein RGA1 isoform X1 [Cannabis sativa]